jgi:sugar/nucleoside kinase (ribokinase family)
LGLKVGFIGKCGDDVFGRFMLSEMQQHGVDTSHVIVVEGRATGLSVILNHGVDRAILTYPGLIPDLTAEEVSDDLLKQARHLHVASYFLQISLQAGLARLFERARALGLTTSLDTNFDPSEEWRNFDELLAVTNVFLPNEVEVRSLARAADTDAAAQALSGKVETLVVKLGARGAMGVQAGQTARVASIPVQVVDTVGAGDSFDAGFLYGYLQGWPFERALRGAAVCGALSTLGVGGTGAQATLAEVLRELS